MKWLWKIAVKKALQNFVKVGIAGLGVAKPILEQYGIKIEIDEAVAIAGFAALIELIRNWLKVRWNIKIL